MRQGQFGGIILKVNKFQYTKIHIITAVRWVFPSQSTPKSMSAGASPHTPLAELTVLPRPPSWFQGGRFAAGGEWREEREGLRGGGKRGMGKGGESGKFGGIAPWLLGDRRPWLLPPPKEWGSFYLCLYVCLSIYLSVCLTVRWITQKVTNFFWKGGGCVAQGTIH